MAENGEPGSGAEEIGTAADPVAVALALGRGALDPRAAAYLAKQGRLADLQADILEREEPVRHWSLRLRHISDVLKLAFEFSVAIVLLGVVALLANAVWSAVHDDGLVIEAFSVPPDLATRGLTGQVVATRMLDNLSTLEAESNSNRAPGSFANNWGDDIKVEIPETGVSIGEVNRYLRQLLGSQTHISGEVVHEGSGITVAARAGADPATQFSGPETDFDSLLSQAAEAVFARTQPYRYGVHLMLQGRVKEAITHWQTYSRIGPVSERAWAFAGLTNAFLAQHRVREEAAAAQSAIALKPDFAWGWTKLATAAAMQDRPEAALAANRKVLQLLDGSGASDLRPEVIPGLQRVANNLADNMLGDRAGYVRLILEENPELVSERDMNALVAALLGHPGTNVATVTGSLANYGRGLAGGHDVGRARHVLSDEPGFTAAIRREAEARHDRHADMDAEHVVQEFTSVALAIADATDDWPRLLQAARAMDAADGALDAAGTAPLGLYPPVRIWPSIAYGEAMTGNFAAAHAEIDKTPGDCDLCLRMRGKIDAAQKNYGGAAFWFARAAALAPSIPFAFADWGAMLMQKGDLDGAIAQFALANQKGPHFADPLEMWGESLTAQKHPDLALAKFDEAQKYAPRWGRLHLEWGKALAATGKHDEARAQFIRAAQLDLSTADKAELAKAKP